MLVYFVSNARLKLVFNNFGYTFNVPFDVIVLIYGLKIFAFVRNDKDQSMKALRTQQIFSTRDR